MEKSLFWAIRNRFYNMARSLIMIDKFAVHIKQLTADRTSIIAMARQSTFLLRNTFPGMICQGPSAAKHAWTNLNYLPKKCLYCYCNHYSCDYFVKRTGIYIGSMLDMSGYMDQDASLYGSEEIRFNGSKHTCIARVALFRHWFVMVLIQYRFRFWEMHPRLSRWMTPLTYYSKNPHTSIFSRVWIIHRH